MSNHDTSANTNPNPPANKGWANRNKNNIIVYSVLAVVAILFLITSLNLMTTDASPGESSSSNTKQPTAEIAVVETRRITADGEKKEKFELAPGKGIYVEINFPENSNLGQAWTTTQGASPLFVDESTGEEFNTYMKDWNNVPTWRIENRSKRTTQFTLHLKN